MNEYQAGAPMNAAPQPQRQGNPTQVLIFGILGLAFGLSTGILGLIFSIIALTKANAYIKQYGDIANQVRIGKRLGIAGLICSIALIAFWVIFIVVVVVAASSDPEGTKKVLESVASEISAAAL